MKNKKTVYILLPVVLAIWGLIFYRVFSHLSQDEDSDQLPLHVTFRERVDYTSEKYKLQDNYADPFLKFEPVKATTEEKQQEMKKPVNRDYNYSRRQIRDRVNWPLVEYNGLLKNVGESDHVGLLKIDTRQFLIKTGNKYMDILVNALYADSVVLEYAEEKKTFLLLSNIE